VLAIVLALAPSPLYSAYASLAHRPGGLSALSDQQIAAGVMWVPGSIAFTIAFVVFVYRWLGPEPTRLTAARPARLGVAGTTDH
jgi:cytochrome c oxidase assembly factor CtaG